MNAKMMKLIVIIAVLVLAAINAAQASPASPDELYKSANQLVRVRQYDKAIDQIKTGLADPEITPAQRTRLLKLLGSANLKRGSEGAVAAQATYLTLIEEDATTPADKVEAYQGLADALLAAQAGRDLKDMDASTAEDALQKATQIPGLNEAEQAKAHRALAEFYLMQNRLDLAQKHFEQVFELAADVRTKNDAQIALADIEIKRGRRDHALAIYKKHGLSEMDFHQKYSLPEVQTAAALTILDDPEVEEKARWFVFIYRTPAMVHGSVQWRQAVTLGSKYMPAFAQADPNRGASLYLSFRKALAQPGERDAQEFLLWSGRYILASPGLKDAQYALVQSGMFNALAGRGDVKALASQAVVLASDERAEQPLKLQAALVAHALSATTSLASADVLEMLKPLENKDKWAVVIASVKNLLRVGAEERAREIYSLRDQLLVEPAKATIVCRFAADGPYDVGSWLVSSQKADSRTMGHLDRRYGNNLRFLLETDAAVTGRGVDLPADKDTGDRQTDFHVSCNVNGVYLFFMAHDTHAREVLQGQLRGGSYEMYLAPGNHQPYYTFLARLPQGDANPAGFITMYPNAHYRDLSKDDGSFSIQTISTQDGFATCIFLAWETFYDKLPANGQSWQFDAIRWTRSGGLSFGGSKSVHHRSSWGDLIFENLTHENLLAIKSNILFKAMSNYTLAKRNTGVAGNWQDSQVGDPAFYAAAVEPLLAKLDGYLVKPDQLLTAAEIDRIYDEAVPGWMDLSFKLSQRRSAYLKQRLLTQP